MSDIVIAASEADARAAEAVEAHHARMSGALAAHTEALVGSVARSALGAADNARRELAQWCRAELLPHAMAEEQDMYPAARATAEGRLLVEAMLGEHRVLIDLVRQLEYDTDRFGAAAAATALRTLFESHLAKENELILPLLLTLPGVSVAELLGGMHELLGATMEEHGSAGRDGHSCACGDHDSSALPELDARSIPHAIRHATVFGALDTVGVGGGLVLLAPHDPRPLLHQIGDRWPGRFEVEYLERGPETWRLSLTRSAS
jgi:uncharacterized protein (DUF2249 family)